MKEWTIPKGKAVNTDLIHEELRVALGDKYSAVSTNPSHVVLWVSDDADSADQATAQSVYDTHNASGESTAEQRRKAERQVFGAFKGMLENWNRVDAVATLKALYTTYPGIIDPDDYAGLDALNAYGKIHDLAGEMQKTQMTLAHVMDRLILLAGNDLADGE